MKAKRPKNFSDSQCQDAEWVCMGADLSLATMSLAAIARTVEGKLRARAVSVRWTKEDDYYERLQVAASAELVVEELFQLMRINLEHEKVFLAYEEPVSTGHIQRREGAHIKQQCQISGSFIGPLLSCGFGQIYEIQANQWRAMVAHDLGTTTYHKKWNDPLLTSGFHCAPKNVGKFRAKQWVEKFHPKWDGHWTDIISHGKLGSIPRPENSKAMAIQSDDRYEALAMAEFMRRELREDGTI